ncbi:MAG: hypothetical protein WCK02_10395 [Bacteroidota bacterium]
MKKILIINRILFFLSFFLPFVILPHCEGSSEMEKKAKHKAFQDSVHIADSLKYDAHILNLKNNVAIVASDSLNNFSNLTKHTENIDVKKETKPVLIEIHEFFKCPTEYSISGYGLAYVFVVGFKLKLVNIIGLVFSLSFLFSFVGIILLFKNHRHRIQTIVPLISFAAFIVFLSYMFVVDKITLEEILWGLWVSLTLSLTNVIITIIRKNRDRSS